MRIFFSTPIALCFIYCALAIPWTYRFEIANVKTIIHNIIFDSQENVLLIERPNDGSLFNIVKFTPNGKFLWRVSISAASGNLYPKNVKVDAFDNVYFGAKITSRLTVTTANRQNITISPSSSQFICIIQLNSTGLFQWTSTIETSSAGLAIHEFDFDGDNGVVIYGDFPDTSSTVTVKDSSNKTSIIRTNPAYFVGFSAKFSSNGVYQWSTSWINLWLHAVSTSKSRDLFIAGNFVGNIIFTSSLTSTNKTFDEKYDVALVKLDSVTKMPVWKFGINGGVFPDASMATDSQGNLYYSATVSYSFTLHNDSNIQIARVYNLDRCDFIIKINKNGEYLWHILSCGFEDEGFIQLSPDENMIYRNGNRFYTKPLPNPVLLVYSAITGQFLGDYRSSAGLQTRGLQGHAISRNRTLAICGTLSVNSMTVFFGTNQTMVVLNNTRLTNNAAGFLMVFKDQARLPSLIPSSTTTSSSAVDFLLPSSSVPYLLSSANKQVEFALTSTSISNVIEVSSTPEIPTPYAPGNGNNQQDLSRSSFVFSTRQQSSSYSTSTYLDTTSTSAEDLSLVKISWDIFYLLLGSICILILMVFCLYRKYKSQKKSTEKRLLLSGTQILTAEQTASTALSLTKIINGDGTMTSSKTTSEITPTETKLLSTAVIARKNTQPLEDKTLVGMTALAIPGFLSFKAYEDFQLGTFLAKGGCGSVYLGETKHPQLSKYGKTIVIKTLHNTSDQTQIDMFHQELSIMHLFKDDKKIAKFLGYSDSPYMILMKYYSYGNLNSFIRSSDQKKTKEIIHNFSLDIAEGLKAVFGKGFAHCDIKAANVLIDRHPKTKKLFCVLNDFGLSQPINDRSLNVKAFRSVKIEGLSLRYASPECMLSLKHGMHHSIVHYEYTSSDIYAYAIVMYEIVTRILAWS